MLSFEYQFVYWPSEAERESHIIPANERKLGFPNLIGFIDGTDIDFATAPSWRTNEFYGRKATYCTSVQGICDHSSKIRNIQVGYLGSSHDARLFNESDVGKFPERFFSGGQYILGDGAYRNLPYLVPIKRKPLNEDHHPADEKFNTYIAMMRIKIEHAFGILKERFCSLKLLPVKYSKKTGRYDQQRVNDWIRTCVILNNFLMDRGNDALTVQLNETWRKEEEKKMAVLLEKGYVQEGNGNDMQHFESNIDNVEGKEKFEQIKRTVLNVQGKGHLLFN